MAHRRTLALLVALMAAPLGAGAQEAGPTPAPPAAPMPVPQDIPYPGTLQLAVDATDTQRGIIHVHETIPLAHGGPQVVYYPEWLPGNHSPSGPIQQVAGLFFHAGAATVSWSRDPANVFAFHLDVPADARTLTVDFDFLSPVQRSQGRVVMTREMLNLEWNAVVMYPAGYFTRGIPVTATMKFPAGWQMVSALEPAASAAGSITYKTVDLGNLVDSPVLGGKYVNRVQLDEGGPAPVWLDIVGDNAEVIKAKPDQIAPHQVLIQQAYKVFGAHHYNHYDFLLGLSEKMSGEGLEHHQSSEDVTTSKYFTHWDQAVGERGNLTAHEFTHSWDGKFRRPADLWVPDFNTPMRDSLLWVYEGQTQYWGYDPRRPLRPDHQAGRAGCPGRHGGALCGESGSVLASAGRHHHRSHLHHAPAGALAQLSRQRGLLQRRPADLAGCGPADARKDRRRQIAGRFRQGFFRHGQWQLPDQDLYLRRCGGDTERGDAL